MFWMTFCSSGLLGNKQLSTKLVSESKIMKSMLWSVIQLINTSKFIFRQLQLFCVV